MSRDHISTTFWILLWRRKEVLPAAASLSGNRVKGEKQKIKDDWDDDEEDEEESQNTTRGASSVSHSVQAVSK